MTHPVDTVIQDSVAVSKADLRALLDGWAIFADPATAQTFTLDGTEGILTIADGPNGVGVFVYDSADTTSAHSASSGVLVSSSGRRYKRLNPQALLTAAQISAVLGSNALPASALSNGTANRVIGYGADQVADEMTTAELLAAIDAAVGNSNWRGAVLGVANPVSKFAEDQGGQPIGGQSSYFLGANGVVYGCGVNTQQQLGATGDGSNLSEVIRLPQPAGVTFTAIYPGPKFCFAIDSDGYPWSIGDNTYGQLGLGDTTERGTWVRIPFFFTNTITVSRIVVHKTVTTATDCALFLGSDTKLYYTGRNNTGERGDGTAVNTVTSTPVVWAGTSIGGVNLTNVTDFAIGTAQPHIHVIANGVLYGAGENSNGQLGAGDVLDKTTAVAITFTPGVANIEKIVKGSFNTWMILTNGDLYGCGLASAAAPAFGSTPLTQQTSFIQVSDLATDNVVDMVANASSASGTLYQMVKLDTNRVKTWGYNANGNLGQGDLVLKTTPAEPSGSFQGSVAEIKAFGQNNTGGLMLRAGNQIYGTGRNVNGQLVIGDSSGADINTFTEIVGISGNIEDWVTYGYETADTSRLFVLTNKAVLGGGYNNQGGVGIGNTIAAIHALQDVRVPFDFG